MCCLVVASRSGLVGSRAGSRPRASLVRWRRGREQDAFGEVSGISRLAAAAAVLEEKWPRKLLLLGGVDFLIEDSLGMVHLFDLEL